MLDMVSYVLGAKSGGGGGSGSGVSDVQVDGTSVVTSGTANIPLAGANTYGVVKKGDSLTVEETVSGSTASITAVANHAYVCGEVASLAIAVPESGCFDVVFESGSTPTALTLTLPTGYTLEWLGDFDDTSLDASCTYEINIKVVGAKCLGVAAAWT